MADRYDNTNSGALFKNDYKEEEKHPDYRGNAELECPHCSNKFKRDIAAWLKTSKKGNKFMSLVFNKPWVKGQQNGQEEATADSGSEEVPF